VEATFRNLDPLAQTTVSAEDVTVIGENGKRYDADDISEPPREFVFSIEEEAINQDFELNFRDAPAIPFSIGQKANYVFATEIGAEPALLPHVCKVEDLPSVGKAGRLTFYQPEETGVILGYVGPDGSDLTQVCSGIAFGDLQLAGDGATLLLVTPQQGWPSLYLIEPEGEIYPLVSNGLNIEARFDPSGRRVLFATERIGEIGRELYAFDRQTSSTHLVKEGHQITFNFLTDERLIIDYRETEDSDRQSYVGPADGSTLDLLDIPEDIPGNRSVSADGQHLIYYELDSLFNLYLFISDLDGSNAQELVRPDYLRVYSELSSDSQSVLIGIGEGSEAGDKIELHNLASDKNWTIATSVDEADFGFSADGQWASAVTITGRQRNLYIIHTTDGNIRKVNGVVNAFFSPDSSQLAYTIQQTDGALEMFVTSLNSEDAQSLGPGVVTGWYPQ
jgi:Tol biopolymer transport system component